ncbi:putative CoA transferase [Actinacidiphila reveromycinica]|uniref:Putative CoA transferase n=1 Tax=Actinacidiphila reveromycinica TaxID=659352 RepID=A0A7U3VS42_9ACTN|nr:CoA transferase [Streptomyces sp. SN-593]BBB01360.1 putative CoA transferase [Streptomyces sp. SN-593]
MDITDIIKPGALEGVRVADFGWVLAGPYATMLLGYMGAEVIKIESRRRIDEQRIVHRAGVSDNVDASSNFFEINLNKRSVTLNLSTPEGAALARRIVAQSDIVVENMRPGVMDRLGLGYADLAKVREDIVMVSISGWGQTGPLREYTAYAPCFASFGGLAHMMGYADGEPNTGTSAMDARSGTAAAFAVLMALAIRRRTGQGQYIDMASGEALSCLIGDVTMDYLMNGRSPSRDGNRDAIMAPHNCYRCAGDDQWISIAVGTEAEWEGLCDAMGRPAWTGDADFSGAYERWRHQERLDALVQEWTSAIPAEEVMHRLQKHGVAAVPSFDAERLFDNEHLRERGSITSVEHPVLGERQAISPPWQMSATPPKIDRYAPLLGEHNDYVLREMLGLPDDEIARLVEEKVVY